MLFKGRSALRRAAVWSTAMAAGTAMVGFAAAPMANASPATARALR